ncbi:MAG TPA: hypothetical protein VEA16_19440 [Vicinamibacterales bacterium]|nr:hypothetical protein [Vicinamibacterales bacterium]
MDSPQASPPDSGGEEVRVISKRRSGRYAARLFLLLAVLLLGAGLIALRHQPAPSPQPVPAATLDNAAIAPARAALSERPQAPVVRAAPRPTPTAPAAAEIPAELPSLELDDIAAYIRPGDPEPTAAELIDALRHAGIHDGIAAFNPPGTSPPLQGLAVPEDFPLPEGYVRHHQVTDAGEPIEPILMFSPDYVFYDERGQPIAIPENRVVPPELAPPGLPIRLIELPSP